MKPEDKELLIKDFCARLPYDVKVLYNNKIYSIDYISGIYEEIKLDDSSNNYTLNISCVKPYLFPISNMTEEQKKEYNILCGDVQTYHYEFGDIIEDTVLYDNWESIDYLNAHYFDYRGLIEKSLALDATGLNIY